MRLIDADSLINAIMTEWGSDPKYYEGDDDATTGLAAYADRKILERIACTPTVYAEPVKHGRWIDQIGLVKCSFCQTHFTHDEVKGYNYCPNCGARMDEEEGCL